MNLLSGEPKLPDNWRLVTEMHGGSGYGDELFSPTLYRWERFTVGRLWWKKSRQGWVLKGRFGSLEDPIEYAIRTEHNIQKGVTVS